MTESIDNETTLLAQAPTPPAKPAEAAKAPRANAYPVLEQLAALYPHLFGATFRPLKRGIFQDLLAAHPDTFEREALKAALSIHTRSTRYLSAVSTGQQRHDLQGNAVEAMAPQHAHQALLEVFRRRQGRTPQDLLTTLRERIVLAFEASGLSASDYSELAHSRDEAANAVLADAMAEAQARAAKAQALQRAYASSGKTVEEFADMYGMDPREVAALLKKRVVDTPSGLGTVGEQISET